VVEGGGAVDDLQGEPQGWGEQSGVWGKPVGGEALGSAGSARSSAAWAIIVVAAADQVEPGQPCREAEEIASVLRASIVRTSPELQAMTPSTTGGVRWSV
jgi:hypothetical protein